LERVGTSYRNLSIGGNAAAWNPTGDFNIAVGYNALRSAASNVDCIGIGYRSLDANSAGSGTIGIGRNALFGNTGSYNTGIGGFTFTEGTNISNCIGLGFYAGHYETAGSKLYIDAFNRTSEALGRTGAIIYGVMDATPANQTLALNATVSVLGDIYTTAWTTWTPTITVASGTAPAYTTTLARYKKIGKRVFVELFFDGDGGAEGNGAAALLIDYPVNPAAYTTDGQIYGSGYYINDATKGAIYPKFTTGVGNTFTFYNLITGANFTGNDQNNATRRIAASFNYEAA
jgi:hypothetical protein